MQDWQKDFLTALAGQDLTQMKIYMGGRQIGKSTLAQMWNIMDELSVPSHKIIQHSMVDGKTWYTVKCTRDVADWVRLQPNQDVDWYEHIDHNWVLDRTRFDISEEFYVILKLTWG